jgi:hypothetical protein
VTATQIQQEPRTVYRDEYVTELRSARRIWYIPVTEYRWEPRWHNWWNPFGEPQLAYHLRPVLRWETRYEEYQQPVTYRQLVPETRVVDVPRRTLQFEEREVIERAVVRPSVPPQGIAQAPRPAGTPDVVGIHQIRDDPPRQGLVPLPVPSSVRR